MTRPALIGNSIATINCRSPEKASKLVHWFHSKWVMTPVVPAHGKRVPGEEDHPVVRDRHAHQDGSGG